MATTQPTAAGQSPRRLSGPLHREDHALVRADLDSGELVTFAVADDGTETERAATRTWGTAFKQVARISALF